MWTDLFLRKAACYRAGFITLGYIPSSLPSYTSLAISVLFFFLHSGTASTEKWWINFIILALKQEVEAELLGYVRCRFDPSPGKKGREICFVFLL